MLPRLLLLLTLLAGPLAAQQKPQYSQYMLNNYLLNPAISGIEDYADIKAGYRNQWTGIEGAPVTTYLSVHTKLGRDVNAANSTWTGKRRPVFAAYQQRNNKYRKVRSHHGVGGLVLLDKIGPFSRTEVNLSYAYHLLLSQQVKLSAGISAGFTQYLLKGDQLTLLNPNDNAVGNFSSFQPEMAAGLWLYSADFYIGFSSTQLLGQAYTFDNSPYYTLGQRYVHYFLTGAYKITPNEKLAITPSILIKWVRPAQVSYDVNLRVSYADRLWGGVSYRRNDAVSFLAGLTFNYTFDIGYSYDLGISQLGNLSGGSHEVLLGIRLHNRFKVMCPQNLW